MTSNFPIINFPLLIWEFALIISELQFDISHMIIDTISHSSISDITYLTIWFTLFSLQFSINFPQTNSRYDAICHISIYKFVEYKFRITNLIFRIWIWQFHIWHFAYENNFPHLTFDNFIWEFRSYNFGIWHLTISHMRTNFPSMNFTLPIWHNFPQLNFRYLRFDNLTYALFPAISIRFSSLKFERWRFLSSLNR